MGLRGGYNGSSAETSNNGKTPTPTPTTTTTVRSLATLRNGSSSQLSAIIAGAINSRVVPRNGGKSNDLTSLVNGLSEGVNGSNSTHSVTTAAQNIKLNGFTFIKPVTVAAADEQSVGSFNSSSMYSTQSGSNKAAVVSAVAVNRSVKTIRSGTKRPRSGASSSRSRSTKSKRSAAAAAASLKKRNLAASNSMADEVLAAKEDDEDDNEEDDDGNEEDRNNDDEGGPVDVAQQDESVKGPAVSRSPVTPVAEKINIKLV